MVNIGPLNVSSSVSYHCSGNPNEEETYHYAKTILQLATRNPDGRNRVLLIGGGIANFTDVAKTFKVKRKFFFIFCFAHYSSHFFISRASFTL